MRLRRCRQILRNSPTALRVLKAALNAAEDGHAGLQALGGEATSLFYQTAEGNEVRLSSAEPCDGWPSACCWHLGSAARSRAGWTDCLSNSEGRPP